MRPGSRFVTQMMCFLREEEVESIISRIERGVGPVPYALAAFWRSVGSRGLDGLPSELELAVSTRILCRLPGLGCCRRAGRFSGGWCLSGS